MANQNTNGQGNGGVYVNGGFQPQQSQYFQTFDRSHLSQAPPTYKRPSYTSEQKDAAISLLNQGTPPRKIAEGIGGTCSKSNPYRWRAEDRERRRLWWAEKQRQFIAVVNSILAFFHNYFRWNRFDVFWSIVFTIMEIYVMAVFLVTAPPFLVVWLFIKIVVHALDMPNEDFHWLLTLVFCEITFLICFEWYVQNYVHKPRRGTKSKPTFW